jgi:hypothetical protein
MCLTIPHSDDHEPTATDVPGFGMYHCQRESHGHGGIDGIPSPL